jgi:NtrC-family two-component system sensor histidine kinase KinB
MDDMDWLVMIGGDGTVTAVEGGPPHAWIGRRVEECAGLPEAVQAAARGFVRGLARPLASSAVRRARVAAEGPGLPSFTLLAIEAVPLRPVEVALDALIRRALQPLMVQAESARVALRVETSEDLPRRISVDGDKIAWAVTVLVGNALRHVRRGSEGLTGGQIVVRLAHKVVQRMISIHVEDDGDGMPPTVRRWLLEENPETGQAAGIALRLVHDVVTAHGGGMVIKTSTDANDRGTAVTLWLPVPA